MTPVEAGNCSVKSAKGSWGFLEQGTLVKPTAGLPAPLPYSSAGIATFDGEGAFSGTVTANFGGVKVTGTFTGTYTVDSECNMATTFTNSLGLIVHQAGTVVGQGAFLEARYIYTDDFWVVTGTAKPLASGQ